MQPSVRTSLGVVSSNSKESFGASESSSKGACFCAESDAGNQPVRRNIRRCQRRRFHLA